MWLLDVIKTNIGLVVQHFGHKNHLFVFMKQKLGLMNQDLAIQFNLKETKVSKIFSKWIKSLPVLLKNLIMWSDREAVRKYLPCSFSSFKNCLCIIDCKELFIERPQNQLAQAQVYPNYKSHNTVKYLIGTTTAGAVSFMSYGWGGEPQTR